jgi:eukaryotic-like serine/threonine-protein kinase
LVDVGDILAGKYRVERVLGRGGMGYVVSAFHTQLGQSVAVKFMNPELCEREEPVTRFLREARAAVRIKNEHVARVLDVGTLESGAPYMVMEYLDGHDLAEELDKRIQLPTYAAVDYLLQASEAIAEAHALGIVHRDLKPANLFLTRRLDGTPLIKVLDFGISKALVDEEGQPASSLTATQALIGSPQYMSPEQVRKPKTVDGRSDVWALGVILYELLSGRQPFAGDVAMSVLAAVVSDPAPSIRELRPDVPVELERVILRCLEKKPEARYQSVAELAQALEPFAPPTAVPSIQRISGTLRTPTPLRISGEMPTLQAPDGSTPPMMLRDADTVQATPDSFPVHGTPEQLAGLRADSKTAGEWGKSTKNEDRGRSRRNVITAIGVGVVFAVISVTVVAFTRLESGPTPTVDSAVATAPAAPPSSPPAATTSAAVVEPASATTPPIASSVPPAESRHPSALVAPHVAPKGPKTGPSATPPATSAPSTMHPLEGRR